MNPTQYNKTKRYALIAALSMVAASLSTTAGAQNAGSGTTQGGTGTQQPAQGTQGNSPSQSRNAPGSGTAGSTGSGPSGTYGPSATAGSTAGEGREAPRSGAQAGSQGQGTMPGVSQSDRMQSPGTGQSQAGMSQTGIGQQSQSGQARTFTGQITPLNARFQKGQPSGQAQIIVDGQNVTFVVDARGLPADTPVAAHLHGAPGISALPPSMAADKNRDGAIDKIESMPYSGTDVIPLNGEPAKLDMNGPGYPKTTADGSLNYRKQVPLADLQKNLNTKFGINNFDPSQFVIYLHGVSEDTQLPEGVKSPEASKPVNTLPVAYVQIRQSQRSGTAAID